MDANYDQNLAVQVTHTLSISGSTTKNKTAVIIKVTKI
jgi:hypothetical protein